MRSPRRPRRRALICATLFLAVAACSGGEDKPQSTESTKAAAPAKSPIVEIKTNKGTIAVELYSDKAPKSVENFLAYAESGFYNGTIFHRVINDFMIQGGGYTANLERKETRAPIPNEANNGLKNEVGTVAMARTSDPNSATSQFFINVRDNAFLDFQSETPQGWGYAVFGKVVEGMDIVNAIKQTPTSDRGGAFANLPQDQVVIESVSVRKSS